MNALGGSFRILAVADDASLSRSAAKQGQEEHHDEISRRKLDCGQRAPQKTCRKKPGILLAHFFELEGTCFNETNRGS